MIITHSSMESFKTCRHKFKLRYIDKIIPETPTNALAFGTAMHELLAEIFNTIQVSPGDTKEELINRLCKQAELLDLDLTDRSKLKGMIIGYVEQWYESDRDEYEVIDVEKEFSVTAPFWGCSLSGKVDGIVRRKIDGKVFILEHKTASIVNDAYIEQKDIDSQTMLYAIAMQEVFDIKIHGAIHDILKKPQIRQKKDETEEQFAQRLETSVTQDNFTRIEVEFSDAELNTFEKQLYYVTQDMIECELDTERCYRCTGACLGKYGSCEYLKLCRGKFDENEIPSGFIRSRGHEELSEQTCSDAE